MFGVAAFTTQAEADDPAESITTYVVQEGEGCKSIAEKLFGDPNQYDILHRYNPDLGPQPHNLKAGTTLHVPSRSADAVVAFTRNQVRVESPDARPAKVKDPLFRGNRVVTGPASAAGIDFREDAELVLGEETLVVIFGATRASAQQSTASLVSGNLRTRLAELAGHKPASVSTPSAEVAIGGGEAKVSVDRASATRLAVYRGASSIAAASKKVEVAQGFGSKAEKGLAPSPPRPLPPAPVWTRLPPALSVASGETVDVSAEYAAAAPAAGLPAPQRWHVEVARDAEMRDVVIDTTVPAKVTTLEAKHLGAGGYFVRVSAIDDDAFEGPFGPAAKLQVAVATTHRAAGADRRVELAIAPAGLACAVDGAPLAPYERPYTVTTTRAHHVRCAAAPPGDAVVETVVPPDVLGVVVGDARLVGGRGANELSVELRDRDGRAVTDAEVTAAAPRGVELGAARVEGDRLLFPVRWARGIQAFAVRIQVNGVETATTKDIAVKDIAVPGEPAPAAPPPDKRIELAMGAVLGAVGDRAREVGGGVALTLGTSTAVGPGDFAIGVRGGYELYRFRADTGVVWADVAPVGVALSYRVRLGGSPVAPYVSAFPHAALYGTSASAAPGSSSNGAVPGVTFALGVGLRAGAGAFFADGGYRAAQTPDIPHVDLSGFVAGAGYRFAL